MSDDSQDEEILRAAAMFIGPERIRKVSEMLKARKAQLAERDTRIAELLAHVAVLRGALVAHGDCPGCDSVLDSTPADSFAKLREKIRWEIRFEEAAKRIASEPGPTFYEMKKCACHGEHYCEDDK